MAMGDLEDYRHITTIKKSITCLTVLLSHTDVWGFFAYFYSAVLLPRPSVSISETDIWECLCASNKAELSYVFWLFSRPARL